MRVAHIITRLIIGGAQENTVLCCEDLARDFGDDVLLITGPSLGPEGDLMADAEGRGVRIQLLPRLRREIHPRDWWAYRDLQKALREFRPDVVHTHGAKGGILGREAAWSLRVPAVVHTVHGAPFHPYQGRAGRWLYRLCERHAAGRCHALISVADAMTDLLVTAGVAPRQKFTTIYSGMEMGPFLAAETHRAEARQRWQLADDDFVIGNVARLFHLKGHAYVLTAAAEVVREMPHARFLLVGDGVLRSSLERRVRQLGLDDHFRFAGLLPPRDIPLALAAMDLVVHASLREGLARVLPQALLAGRPVVSFDIDGAREVVRDGQTGILLPPQDAKGLARAILELGHSPQRRAAYAELGRELCRTMFHHRNMTAKIRRLYQEILARRM